MTSTALDKHLAAIGAHLTGIGAALSAIAALDKPSTHRHPAASDLAYLKEHYSQQAQDARQYPVLTLFTAKTPVLPWVDVRAVALQNGYGTKGVGGLLTALLEWADPLKMTVRMTAAGHKRLAEITARASAAA